MDIHAQQDPNPVEFKCQRKSNWIWIRSNPFRAVVFLDYTVQLKYSQHTYANPTPMSTSEGLSTGRSEDSRSHHWHLVVDGNVAYHLEHNISKS